MPEVCSGDGDDETDAEADDSDGLAEISTVVTDGVASGVTEASRFGLSPIEGAVLMAR